MTRYAQKAQKLRELAADLNRIADNLEGLAPKRPAKSLSDAQTGERPGNWVGEAVDLWTAEIGHIAPGRMGKELSPLVREYGWPVVKETLVTYLGNRPYQRRDGSIWGDLPTDGPHNAVPKNTAFMNPNEFVRTFQTWKARIGCT